MVASAPRERHSAHFSSLDAAAITREHALITARDLDLHRKARQRLDLIDLFLAESVSRQGLGQEAVQRVMQHLIDDRGHHRIVIDPSAENFRAIATYAACGFEPVGVMRQYEKNTDGSGWHDALFMEYVI